jgi:hypothetical protein
VILNDYVSSCLKRRCEQARFALAVVPGLIKGHYGWLHRVEFVEQAGRIRMQGRPAEINRVRQFRAISVRKVDKSIRDEGPSYVSIVLR